MTTTCLAELTRALPADWVRTYVRTFESGRVQKHPQARFVNGRGECCLVAALLGARAAGEVVGSAGWAAYRSELEELSRRFESLRVSGQQFYEECLLTLVTRSAAGAAGSVGHDRDREAVTERMRGR